MNVPVHVVLRLDPVLNALEKVYTARPTPPFGLVTEAQRRTVCDEDIRVLGDQVPLSQALFSSLQIESASERRLPGSALKIEVNPKEC